MDKTTGEVTTRRAPDLTDPQVQDTISEPELMGMTATGDLSMPDSGSVVCSETETVDGTVHRGELGIVVQEPISVAEPGCGQKRKFSSNESGVWVCFGRAKAQKRCNDLLTREK
jgi:hypothetical protein